MILSHRQSLGRHTTSELKGRMTETITQIYPFSIYFSGHQAGAQYLTLSSQLDIFFGITE